MATAAAVMSQPEGTASTVRGDITPVADSEMTEIGQLEGDEASSKDVPHLINESDPLEAHQQVLDEKATPQDGVHDADTSVPAIVPRTDTGDQPSKTDKNPFGLKPEYKTALKDFIVRILLRLLILHCVFSNASPSGSSRTQHGPTKGLL